MSIPRSRGATSGVLLMALGIWGLLIPFLGNEFGFGYADGGGQEWTAAHGWLQVLPGAAAALGGVMLLVSRNRATAMFGAWLAIIAGAWFVVGRAVAEPLPMGTIGGPEADSAAMRAALELAYFSGLGTLIVAIGAMAVGRLSVRSLRDIRYAETADSGDNAAIDAERTGEPRRSIWRGWGGRRSAAH